MKKKELFLTPEELKNLLEGAIRWEDLQDAKKVKEHPRRKLDPPQTVPISPQRNAEQDSAPAIPAESASDSRAASADQGFPARRNKSVDDDFAAKWDLLTAGTDQRKQYKQVDWGLLKKGSWRNKQHASEGDVQNNRILDEATGVENAEVPGPESVPVVQEEAEIGQQKTIDEESQDTQTQSTEPESAPSTEKTEAPPSPIEGTKVYLALATLGIATLGTWIYYVFA